MVNWAHNNEFLENLYDGVYGVDDSRTILFWNRAAEELTGYKAAEVIGRFCYDEILSHLNERGERLCGKSCPMLKTMADQIVREEQVYLRHKQGQQIAVNMRFIPATDDQGNVIGAMALFVKSGTPTNPSQIKELMRKAFLDSLTGLANREYMENKVRMLLASESERGSRSFSMLFFQLENLREVNDEFGMSVGNEVLKIMAKTIAENMDDGDILSRWQGGLFMLLCYKSQKGMLLNWANKVRDLIQTAGQKYKEELELFICVGGAIAHTGATEEYLYKTLEEQIKARRHQDKGLEIVG